MTFTTQSILLLAVTYCTSISKAEGDDWKYVRPMCGHSSPTTTSCPTVNTINTIRDRIPSSTWPTISSIPYIYSIVPTLKPYIDGIESSTNNIPTMYDHVVSTIPSIKSQMDDVKQKIFEIELILTQRHNQTIDELKEYLDTLHSRVQLRPTAAPTLTPTTDPTRDPTEDPTQEPTLQPTKPSRAPTPDPTIDPTIVPTSDPTTDPTNDPTTDPTVKPTPEPSSFPSNAPTQTWIDALTLGGDDNSYIGVIIDIGRDSFNSEFQNSEYHIIKRECATCVDDYKQIYYKRLLNAYIFDAYDYMKRWRQDSNNNRNGLDFKIYTNVTDALEIGDNYWGYCDIDDGSKGAFSTCGRGQWTRDQCSYPLDANGQNYDPNDTCNKAVKFSIFVGDPSYYGVINAQNAITNEKQSIGDINGGNGYDIEKDGEVGGLCMVINAEQLDLILIGLIGVALIVMNGIFIGWKCGCCKCGESCPCSSARKYKFKTVKFHDKFDHETEDQEEVEMEQIEESK